MLAHNRQKITDAYRKVQAAAAASGLSMSDVASACASCGDAPILRQPNISPGSAQSCTPKGSKLERMLCYLEKGSESFNKFGQPSAIKLRTNSLILPDADNGFNIGPGPNASSLGVFFPRTWVGEQVYHGIERLKVSFAVSIQEGNLTPDNVKEGLFEDLDFRILQVGSVDPFNVVIQLEAQDAQSSQLIPSAGGAFLPRGGEWVPFFLAPELYTFDFQGLAPGDEANDQYTLQAGIRTYWEEIC